MSDKVFKRGNGLCGTVLVRELLADAEGAGRVVWCGGRPYRPSRLVDAFIRFDSVVGYDLTSNDRRDNVVTGYIFPPHRGVAHAHAG